MSGPSEKRFQEPVDLDQLIEDLAALMDGPTVEITFSFDRLEMQIRSNGRVIFHPESERGWMRVEPRRRAEYLLRLISHASGSYRIRRTRMAAKKAPLRKEESA